MTQFLQYLFWISIIIVFYTYIGYGILLYILVKNQRKTPPGTAINTSGTSSRCYATYRSLQRRKDHQSKNG